MAGSPLFPLQLTFLTFFLLAHFVPVNSDRPEAADNTLLSNAQGMEITETVIQRLYNSEIFPDDHYFLLRLAYSESRFGEHPKASSEPGYCGGIWQVDYDKFVKTQDLKNSTLAPILTGLHTKIRNHFKIPWMSVKWCDLQKPLYSGLAVSIYLSISSGDQGDGRPLVPRPPPITIRRQANYWDIFYRPEYNGDTTVFVEKALDLHERWEACKVKLDLVVAVDASGSFKRPALSFGELLNKHVRLLLDETFADLKTTRIGMFLFSNRPYHIADVDNDYTVDELIASALQAVQFFPGGNSRIDLALEYATYALKNATEKEQGRPQIILMFTDGHSSSNISKAVDFVRDNDIRTIVVGIGNETDSEELEKLALGEKANVYKVTRIDTLPDLFFGLRAVLCKIPQKPLYARENVTYGDTLKRFEKRYYILVIENKKGITVDINICNNGSVNAYWSYTDQYPFKGAHDGAIDEDGRSYIKATMLTGTGESYAATGSGKGVNQEGGNVEQRIYFTVVGGGNSTSYEVCIMEGDQDYREQNGGVGRRAGGTGYDRAILMIYGVSLVLLAQRMTSLEKALL